MRLFSAKYPGRPHMAEAFISLHSRDSYAFFLDRENHPTERFSVIGGAAGLVVAIEDAIAALANEIEDIELPFSFRPGLVGGYSYEGEELFMMVDRAIVFDHESNLVYFVGIFSEEKEFESWQQAALLRLALIGGEGAVYKRANPVKPITIEDISFRHSDEEYLALIEQSKQYIAQGDAYQLCLTNQLTAKTDSDPYAVFLKLRELNPAPFMSFIRLGSVSLASSSPEQFLKGTKEGLLITKPIKGTRPRNSDPELDKQLAEELLSNEKERAENLMIVDLMRNDLGRVSEPDDVVVSKLFEIESYASVHQLVSTVQAQLVSGKTIFDAIRACFPAGSMTGAPKIRAMEILASLESGPRGLYSGCFGFIGFNGAFDLAMTIRTIVFESDNAAIGIGGGIT
ncbi:MAG: anthranilate synthase component I family protein, partial [Microbacteriaceae bacterium]|nr:anthranilate synthase component I family protein [Microbacteriaceae bacterium]